MNVYYSWFRQAKKSGGPSAATQSSKQAEEYEVYGVTDELIDKINSFTLDTFKNFPLPDEQEGLLETSGNVQKDLSDWQERHATLVLSKVKELSQLRFRLCPRFMKERQFWRVEDYRTARGGLGPSYVSWEKKKRLSERLLSKVFQLAVYELRAVRQEKLRQMALETKKVSDTDACEVEMLEAKQPTRVETATSMEENTDS